MTIDQYLQNIAKRYQTGILREHSYREKYKELLKIDFPRVPYPDAPETFWRLVAPGGELRGIHLLEHPEVGSKKITKSLTKTDLDFIPYADEQRGSRWKPTLLLITATPMSRWARFRSTTRSILGGYPKKHGTSTLVVTNRPRSGSKTAAAASSQWMKFTLPEDYCRPDRDRPSNAGH